jgi:TonB-linked SusC/RagA family outer membrane protein
MNGTGYLECYHLLKATSHGIFIFLKHQTPTSMRKIYKSLTVAVVFLLLCSSITQGQDATITGTIKDDTGSPVPGANIIIKGTTSGTTSDANGAFSINADPSDVLVISFIGYKTQEIVAGNQSTLDISMESDLTSLDEVVVVGYGEQKRATLSGSVSVVSGTDIVKSPAINLSNSLAGRLPGLTAINTSSEPGNDNAILRIRGVGTFGNADPLIVVDGIPSRSLNRIDPATIESISVLKDASAAIYGAQAANGVILITTKKGKVGKPTVSASFNQGFGRPTRVPEMADAAEYVTLLNEISEYNGNAPLYTADEIQKFRNGSDPWRYPNTDWFKETLKPWSGQSNTNVSLNGGSETMRYFVSASHRTQDGFYYNSGTKYNQYDFRTNLDGDIGKYINVGVGLLGRMEDRNYPMRDAGSIFRMVMRGKPNLPAYWPNGLPGPDIEYGDNPVVVSTKATGYDHNKTYVINTNFKLTVKIPWIQGLSITGNAAIDKGYNHRKQWATPWYLNTWDGVTVDGSGNPVVTKSKKGYDAPRLTQQFGDNQNILLNALLNYQRTIADKHAINFLVGAEKIKGSLESFEAQRRNFPSTSLDQLFAGALDQYLGNYGTAGNSARLNYFGRVNYSFKEKFLAEFVWRYQGSYIFEESSRFGFFPGISLGYVISEEDFWESNVGAIDYLKIRGSWGQTGNDLIDPYQFLAVYNVPRSYNNGDPLSFNDGTKLNLALAEDVLSNRNTSWEVATQRNLGIDMDLFGSKVSIVADYFSNLRDDILWRRNASVPASSGVTLPRENIGKTKNNGFDFSIDYRNQSGDISYQIGLNGGYARSEITFWDEAPGAPAYQRSTGAPIHAATYYEAIGIFRDQNHIDSYPHLGSARPGDVIFADTNDDGAIDANDMVRSNKTNIPRWTGGLHLGVKFKGFDFTALFQGAAGAQTYIQTESGTIGNFLKSFYDERWTESNPSSTTPRTFDRGAEYWASLANTYWLRDTDYLRLKNIELGYSLPGNLLSRAHIQGVRIYVNAYNLLTYSPDMKDFDPELTGSIDSGSTSGQSYPLQKIINMGLSLTF